MRSGDFLGARQHLDEGISLASSLYGRPGLLQALQDDVREIQLRME